MVTRLARQMPPDRTAESYSAVVGRWTTLWPVQIVCLWADRTMAATRMHRQTNKRTGRQMCRRDGKRACRRVCVSLVCAWSCFALRANRVNATWHWVHASCRSGSITPQWWWLGPKKKNVAYKAECMEMNMRTKKDVQVSYSVSRSFALVSSLVESQWLRSLCDSLLAFCCFLNLKRVEIIDLSHIVHENLAEKRFSQKKNFPFIVLCICSFEYRFWRMCINPTYPNFSDLFFTNLWKNLEKNSSEMVKSQHLPITQFYYHFWAQSLNALIFPIIFNA